jgi:DNA-binding CsgD family transcriptional regulator
MSPGPALLPSRRRLLEELVAGLAARVPGDGSGRLVLLTAPAGAGLSTFLRGLAHECGPGGRIAVATVHRLLGLPWERELPGATLAPLGIADDAETVDGPAGPAVLARRWLDAVGPGSAVTGGWDRVVLVEDAQYADPLSVQTLVSAVRRPSPVRRLIVLAWRTPRAGDVRLLDGPGTSGDAGPAHADQARESAGRDARLYDAVTAAADAVVALPPLTAGDVGTLAEQRGVTLPAAQVERLLTHTDGLARDTVEVLEAVLPEDLSSPYFSFPAPATAARHVRARLHALGGPGVRLVRAVAVVQAADRQGQGIETATAARVGAVEDVAVASGEALRSGLLVPLDEYAGRIRLSGPIARRVVLDEMGPVERSALHLAAAETVEDPTAALRHRWHASPVPDEGLAARLERAAGEQAHQGAWGSAADLLVLASRASVDPEARAVRLIRAVDALVGAGDVAGASGFLAELESLRETPLRDAVLGYLAVVRGRAAQAEDRLRRAWQLVNARRDPATASLIAQRHVLHALARCRARDLVDWADRSLAIADPASPAAFEAAAIRGLGEAVVHGAEKALADYRDLVERVPEGPVAQRVTMASGWLRLAADDLDRAQVELESAVPTDFLGGSLRISLWARAWLARTQFHAGDWAAALGTASAGAELAHRSGMTLLVPLLEWTRTQVHALRGEWEAAEASLRAGDAGTRDYEIMRVPAALARAALAEARADYPSVVRALTPLTEHWAREWVDEPGFWPWPDVHANALVLVGRYDDADAFLRRHEQRAADAGPDSARARLAYARGRWHGQRGDLDAARACFEHGLDLLGPLPLRYDRARVHFAYGQTLRRAGRRADADAVIAAAREAYLALGATTYVARCDRELAAGGVHVARGERGFDELTPQEDAVATLVGQGRSNKEVAAELFLSVKTVQYHLTRIYAKLGIRSRTELAARRAVRRR